MKEELTTQHGVRHHLLIFSLVTLLIIVISYLHYTTSTDRVSFHIVYMQSYFLPILLAALTFGKVGGLGTALAISAIYFPHIVFQWGGFMAENLMRFVQIGLFIVVGYLTGLKTDREREEKQRYLKTAQELKETLQRMEQQEIRLTQLEEQLRRVDRLALIGELAATFAHEVRNPLSAIRGSVEIIQSELPQEYCNQEFFHILKQETERLTGVVENYLNLARRSENKKEVFDAREVIYNSALLFQRRLDRRGIILETQLSAVPLPVYGNRTELQQIIVNLMLNAIDELKSGDKLRVLTRVVEEHHRRLFHLIVEDTGPGIAAENQQQIFEPFFTTKDTGTGLGLAIVKRIVENNRWNISVWSEPGKGTRFKITIPIEEEAK